jgi:hypothetical protein
MKFSIPSLNQAFLANGPSNRKIPRKTLVLLLGMLVACPALWAQQSEVRPASDSPEIRELLERVAELEAKVKKMDQLEARVRQLEAEKQSAVPASGAVIPAQMTAAPEKETEPQEEPPVPERMDVSKTLLRIRGFGDVNLHGDNQKGDTTSFTLGQLNLFVTSDISERFKFLSEIVFEPGPDKATSSAWMSNVIWWSIHRATTSSWPLAGGTPPSATTTRLTITALGFKPRPTGLSFSHSRTVAEFCRFIR